MNGNPGKTEFMVKIPRKDYDAIEEGGIDDQTTEDPPQKQFPEETKEDSLPKGGKEEDI